MYKRVLRCFMILCITFTISTWWSLDAQVKRSFVPVSEEQSKLDSLISLYQAQGLDYQQAQERALRAIALTEVTLRYDESLPRPTPDPNPGSIAVDRNVVIHYFTPEELVRKVLLQSNNNPEYEARIQNVRFLGIGCHLTPSQSGSAWGTTHGTDGNRSLSYFEKGTSNFSLERGLLMATGPTHEIEGPNFHTDGLNGGVWNTRTTSPGSSSLDAALDSVALSGTTGQISSCGSILEFVFQPADDKMSFDYIFGSEEYPEYTNSYFNDVFGFFVTGPYDDKDTTQRTIPLPSLYLKAVQPDGTKSYNQYNIAQLPNGDPVGINWTNWGKRSANQSTSWTTPGTLWDTTGVYAAIQANNGRNLQGTNSSSGSGLAMNPLYHTPVFEGDAMMELDGITVKLTAVADGLIPGKWYHLKLGVSNVADASWGSAVFISNLDLGLSESNLEPIPIKEGTGWDASWDTTYTAADEPTNSEGRFPLYSGCARRFKIEAKTSLPGNSSLIFDRRGVAQGYLTLLLDGVPLKSDTVPLKKAEAKFKLTVISEKLPPELEGKTGTLLSSVSIPSSNTDSIIHYTAYNHPTTKVSYRAPTLNYAGKLDLGIEGGTPFLFRSMDKGKSWKLASVPFSPREIRNTLDVDSIDIWLREPNSSCQDIIVPLKFGTASPLITRTVTLPAFAYGTMDQVQGNHIVSSRQDFELIIRPDVAHADKTPIIRTNRKNLKDEEGGLQVTKQADGSYLVVIKSVNEDFEITFDMVVSNEASIENGHVWTRGAELLVYSSESQEVAIYTLSGALTKRFPLVAGETRSLLLPNGVYLVRLGESNETYKVVIR